MISYAYRKFAMLIHVSTIPTEFIAILFKEVVEVTSETVLQLYGIL